MADAFVYRPKFVDIRIKKPGEQARAREPEERACDQVGCRRAGTHRAPKSRENTQSFWWFCTDHVAEYNRQWNYFEGMSEDELSAFGAAERAGHRPTWSFRAGRGDRLSSAQRGFERGRRGDPFSIFGAGGERVASAEPARSIGKVHRLALEALGLEENADAETIRARYADLVKRYHPDSNGGDRSVEGLLQKVIRAYQTLKTAGFV